MEETPKSGNEGSPRIPTTKDLIDMSRILTSDWKMFIREIDVPDREIDAIVEKYKFEQPWEQKYQCLCYWLDDKGNHASFEQLMDAARKSGQVKLVNHIEATLKVATTGSQPGAMSLPVKDPIKRKRRRSFSQSSEESDLQEYSATRLLHDYMQLKMDLLRQDISDLRCESDPNDIIRLLYGNALDVITKLLAPHLEAVKRAANRYCRLNLHHVMVADGMIASAASIEGLLNQMSVTGKWDNTRFLRKAVAAIPHSAPERGVAEAILSHYNLHLVYYERATLLKRKKSESEGNEQATGKNDKLVPLEITVSTAFSDITCEDCHHLQVHVLSTAYGIPEESITYYGAEERHSTTITFLIPRQYTSAVMQRNTQLDAVWVLLELDVIEVAIPEVLSFKPSVDCFLTLLRESRTFTVDLLAVTEVLPYQMYVLLDSDREPLTRFGQTNSEKTAIPWDVTPSSSMDNSETACHDAESNALPAVPEHGALYYHSYSRMSEPPSGLPQLNESTLQRIASHLPSDKWKPLGRVLGLPNRDLDNIATNHYIDPVEQRYQMLQLWVSQNEDATWDKLLDALRTEEVGCSHLARKFRISESKQDDHSIIDGEYVFQKTLPAFPKPQHKVVRREVDRILDRTFQDLLRKRGKGHNLVTVFITGPPACGKTQVCRIYATAVFENRNPEGHYLPVLLWKAGSSTDLANSLRDSLRAIRNHEYLKRIDRDLTVMHTTEQVSQHHLDRLLKEVLVALKDKYKRRPKSQKEEEWLIVIDGASSYDDLKQLMPSLLSKDDTTQWGRGKLLIAVQECSIPVKGRYTAEIRLGPGMSATESLEFLRLSFPHDSEEVLKNVAEQLSCIPLSLAVAVETMKMLRKDSASYTWQRHLEKNLLPSDSMDVDPSDPRHPKTLHCQYNHTLYQALKQAVQRIGVEGNNAHLFFFLGLCEEGTVPLPLLKKLAVFLHGDEEEGMEDALFVQFNEDIRHNSLGLILLEGDAGISVHHVLHVVLRHLAHARLEGLKRNDKQQSETRRTVSAIIKAFCAVYQSTEQQLNYLDRVQDKLRLLPHFIALFHNCIQLYGYQDDTVPRFALYAAQLLQLHREGSKVQNILKTGITVTAAMRDIDILAKVDLKSLYAKELVEANEFGSAIDLLHETVRHRKEQDKLLQEAIARKPKPTRSELDQCRRNFEGLHGDLVAIGYAFKDRGEEGDLAVAEEHVAEVFELLQRGRTEMAVYGGLDWGLMRSETLHLQAQLYQDIQRYDPSLLDELLRMSEDCVPASHHKCQVLRTLTDLLLEDGPQHDVDRAGRLIDRAIDMGHELYGEVHPMLAYSKMTKGRVFLEMENYEAALKLLAEALSLNDVLPAEVRDNRIIPLVYYFQGECYIQQGRYKEAYDVLKEGAELTRITKDGFGPGHPQNTYVMDRLGQVCMHLMQLEEAKQYLEQSACMKVRIRGKSHPELKWNYMQLETVAYECNDDGEALRFRAKRLKIESEDEDCDDCT